MRCLRIIALLCLISALPARAVETIKLSACISVTENYLKVHEADFLKEAGLKIEYVPNNVPLQQPHDFFQDTANGKSEAAICSISPDDWLKTIKDAGVKIPEGQTPVGQVIGRNYFVILANKGAGIKKLSLPQVMDLISGKIANWKELGGADIPVKPIVSSDRLTSLQTFKKTVMHGQSIRGDMTEVKSYEDAMALIEKSPGGVMVNMYKNTPPNTVLVETPAMGRPITLMTLGRPSQRLEAFIKAAREISKKD